MRAVGRDLMADGISIRVRVRRAACTAKLLEYGEPQDMVCTIVNWEVAPSSSSSSSKREHRQHQPQQQQRQQVGAVDSCSPSMTSSFARQIRRSTISFKRSSSKKKTKKFAPTLFFQTRNTTVPTLQACCSLQSVSSYDDHDDSDSLHPSDESAVGDEGMLKEVEEDIKTNTPDIVDGSRLTSSAHTYPIRNTTASKTNNIYELFHQSNNSNSYNNFKTTKRKKFSLPCSSIRNVEMTSSLFRGYRILFVTERKGSYELEFENKNGMDIMMAFLQATLPPERFVNGSTTESGGGGGGATTATAAADAASDTASYPSTLDVEKLTERLAERDFSEETMSERLRRSVGQVVSSIEEISNSFCGNVCCHGQLLGTSSVAPYVPPDEIRDSPPSPCNIISNNNRTTSINNLFEGYPGPVMEIDEEKSLTLDSKKEDEMMEKKRLYLRDHKLPSGLSVEMPE